jgi:hypothetical protein
MASLEGQVVNSLTGDPLNRCAGNSLKMIAYRAWTWESLGSSDKARAPNG